MILKELQYTRKRMGSLIRILKAERIMMMIVIKIKLIIQGNIKMNLLFRILKLKLFNPIKLIKLKRLSKKKFKVKIVQENNDYFCF